MVYLLFLPMVPISVIVWLVWSRNVSYGYWYVTAQCIAWTLGTVSYYMIPTLGPNFAFVWLYHDLDQHRRQRPAEVAVLGPRTTCASTLSTDASSAWPASRPCTSAITLLMALVAQYTVRHRFLKIILWVYFGLTVLSTIYFGWHYIADDIAGAADRVRRPSTSAASRPDRSSTSTADIRTRRRPRVTCRSTPTTAGSSAADRARPIPCPATDED